MFASWPEHFRVSWAWPQLKLTASGSPKNAVPKMLPNLATKCASRLTVHERRRTVFACDYNLLYRYCNRYEYACSSEQSTLIEEYDRIGGI